MLPWSAAAEQEAEPVVVEVAEPEPEALDVLDHEVRALGRCVREPGAVPAQDRCLPAADRLREPGQLGHVAVGAVLVERHESPAAVEHVRGGEALAQELLGEIGGAHFAVGVAGIEVGQHPREARWAESFVACQQTPPDPVERDRKSTRLNSSHVKISYAVFCLKKKTQTT